MTEGKYNIVYYMLEEYDIQTAENIQDALNNLPDKTLRNDGGKNK